MYWIIPLILAFLCTLVNPYVGLVGILFVGEIVIYLFFDGNAEKGADFASGYIEKTDAKYYEILKKAGKGFLNFWCILAVLFLILMTIISLIVETAASSGIFGGPTELTPFLIGKEENRAAYGVVLLIVSIILHIIAVVLIFLRRKYFVEKPKNIKPLKTLILKEENPANRLEHIEIRFGILPVLCIAAAGFFGMLNEYFGWLSLLLHIAYLVGITVISIVAGGLLRFVRKNETMKKGMQYFVNYITNGTPYNHFVIGGVWIATAFLVVLQLLLTLGYRNDIFMVFGLNAGTFAMVCSCLFEIAAAVLITVKRESVKTCDNEKI